MDDNSAWIEVSGTVPANRPEEVTDAAFSGGTDGAESATASLAAGGGTVELEAANGGSWGNDLEVTVDHDTADSEDDSLFNLFVKEIDDDDNTVSSETFRNLSMDSESSRYVTHVLKEESVWSASTKTRIFLNCGPAP